MVIAHETPFAEDHLMTELETLLHHQFNDPALLQRALTHSSSATKKQPSYERLEFLGDRVLGIVVADMLFHSFPQDKEGALAKRHSILVKQGTLEKIAELLNIDQHIRYGRHDGAPAPSPSVKADVVEALIAAMYLDGGFAVADRFIRQYWGAFISAEDKPPEDPKSALQEWAQGKGIELPTYKVIGQSGPDHNPLFIIQVSLPGYPAQQAESTSKQSAQKLAARLLLNHIRGMTE